jgi:hypothetical protein
MDLDLAKRRVNAAIKLTKLFYNYINKRLPLKNLQEKFHAHRGKVTRLELTDIDIAIHFAIKDGKLELFKGVEKPDNIVQMPSDLYFDIFELSYDDLIKEAVNRWRYGDLVLIGEDALADFKLFIKGIKELKERGILEPQKIISPQGVSVQ